MMEKWTCPDCGKELTLVWKTDPDFPDELFAEVNCECGYWCLVWAPSEEDC